MYTDFPEAAEVLRRHAAGLLSLDSVLRAVLSHNPWWVPHLPDGSVYCLTIQPGAREGHQGRYVEALLQPAEERYQHLQVDWQTYRGRQLVQNFRQQADGLHFQEAYSANRPVLMLRFEDRRLQQWVDLLDREEDLEPAREVPQVHSLENDWITLVRDGRIAVEEWDGFRFVVLFTAADRVGLYLASELTQRMQATGKTALGEVQRMSGAQLFGQLAERFDYDGLVLNRGSWQPYRPLGPHAARQILAGVDPRPELQIQPARSRKEMYLFMVLMGASEEWSSSRSVQYQGQEVVQWSSWSPTESFDFRFHPVPASADAPEAVAHEFGPGPTAILCAGLLAQNVHFRRTLPHWLDAASDTARAWNQETLRRLRELEKLLDPATDRIPSTAVRTAGGARFMRQHPETQQADWLRDTRQGVEAAAQLERSVTAGDA